MVLISYRVLRGVPSPSLPQKLFHKIIPQKLFH